MPISTDRFDEIDDDGPKLGTNAHEILSFLQAHADKAFTQSEIVEETGVDDGSAGPTLVRSSTRNGRSTRSIRARIVSGAYRIEASSDRAKPR